MASHPKTADAKKAFASIGAGGAPDHASGDAMMHATATVDYIIVLKGEIWAIMDKGEKLLSLATQFNQTPRTIYQELSISDIK